MQALAIAIGVVSLFVASYQQPQERGPDCGAPVLATMMTKARITAVVRGTTTAIKDAPDGQLATFRVVRVWKGDLRREAVVYNQMV